MELNRRRALVAGVSFASTALAGCLSEGGPGGDADGSDDPETDDGATTPDRTETEDDGNGENGGTELDGELPDGVARVDEPPYEISEPDCDPPEDGRDPLWLCENMAAEPSVAFSQANGRGSCLADEGLRLDESNENSQYYATLLTDESDLERLEDSDSEAVALVEGTDFGSEAVLVAQTGWGSGTVTPHVKRVEATDDGIRAFGCERHPCVYTADLTSRTVAVRFERPETLDAATVSLTVGEEKRVNFAAGEGVVTLGNGSD
ncbi:hypothetical protein [Halostella litorea]|uniref:hypothetical protein n=1 Tax=Halostella litorea TaxID=2528831 RepID=UPI001092D13B|nr:hypothetical protein [Halostella litorea]